MRARQRKTLAKRNSESVKRIHGLARLRFPDGVRMVMRWPSLWTINSEHLERMVPEI